MIKKISALVFFSIVSITVLAQDAYDGVYLTIPKVAIANTLYRNVKVSVGQVLAVNGGAPTKDYDTYTPATNWTSHATVDKLKPQFEARSNTSGLTPPKWLWRRVRL